MEWIKVSECLPEFDKRVLVFDEKLSKEPQFGKFKQIDKRGNGFQVYVQGFEDDMRYGVSHWSEYPEPPKP